jgi:hypothetical protein
MMTMTAKTATSMADDVCLAGSPARNGVCGEPGCVCDPGQCTEHAPESWWFGNKRCDKPHGHRGKHLSYNRGLGGVDERCFRIWNTKDRESVYYEHRSVAAERRKARAL